MAGKGQSNAGVEFHKGVFSAPSFITIGDQYGKKVTGDARQGGKTMMTHPALLGTMGSALAQGDQSVYFDREFRYVNKGSKYVESLPAKIGLTQVRDEKRGKICFGSHDADRRGEFSNNIRCQQYNQQIDKEQNFMKAAHPTTYDRGATLMPDHNREFMTRMLEPDSTDVRAGPQRLYDIGRSANTQFEPDHHRDMFYGGRHVSETKRLGPHAMHLSSRRLGWGHLEATKFKELSQYASKPIIRSTFYRRTGCPGVAGGARPSGTHMMMAGTL